MSAFESRIPDIENLLLLQSIRSGTFETRPLFADLPAAGTSPHAVICNSVPKSGTYLLTEMLKATGLWADLGHHANTRGLIRVRPDGARETGRKIPALLWAHAMPNGFSCPAHIEYSPYVEDYLLSSSRHKMLFIIRDPRDLVISWVDFVYGSESYGRMSPLNGYLRASGSASFPTDEARIGVTIENLPKTRISDFVPWINSPACHTIRFEELYAELTRSEIGPSVGPVLEGICDFLEIPRRNSASFVAALGRGLTSSGRAQKVGIYRQRMTDANLALLRQSDFQKLVLSFGYDTGADRYAGGISTAWGGADDSNDSATGLSALQRELAQCRAERDETRAQQGRLQAELTARIAERDAAWAERDEAQTQQARLQAELTARIGERDTAWAERDEAQAQRQRLDAERTAMIRERDAALAVRNQ